MLYESPDRQADGVHMIKQAFTAYGGPTKVERTANGIIWKSIDYVFDEASHEIDVNGDKFRSKEKGLVDVEGTMVPKAVQIYSPGPTADDGFAYVSQYIRAQGECMGKKVEGWLGYDAIYFAAGISYVTSVLGSRDKRPGINCAWPSFANEYEDGSYECGYLGAGLEDWQFYISVDDKGNVGRGHVVNMEMDLKPNKYPQQLRLKVWDEVKGQQENWQWDTLPGTDLVDIPKLFPDIPVYWASESFMRRTDEKRKIKRSLGWPDFYNV